MSEQLDLAGSFRLVLALAGARLAGLLTAEGKTVHLADLTRDTVLAHMFRVRREGWCPVRIGDVERVILQVP